MVEHRLFSEFNFNLYEFPMKILLANDLKIALFTLLSFACISFMNSHIFAQNKAEKFKPATEEVSGKLSESNSPNANSKIQVKSAKSKK